MRCPTCNSDDSVQHGLALDVVLLQCSECGLVYKLIEKADKESVQGLQDGVYKDLRLRTEVRVQYKMAADRLAAIKKHSGGKRILEIGCATGEFLETAGKAGYDALGVDASKLYADFAKSKGLNVRNGLLDEVVKPEEAFDVISMFHLLEHIPQPGAFLEQVKERLAPGGIIFAVCPNIDSTTRRPFGLWHGNYQQPDHLLFFSNKTLSDLLERSGFEIVESFSREYPHSFFTSLRGYLAIRTSSWRKRKKRIKSENAPAAESKKGGHPPASKSALKYLYKMLPFWLSWILYPVAKPYSMFIQGRGKGHELCVVAKLK